MVNLIVRVEERNCSVQFVPSTVFLNQFSAEHDKSINIILNSDWYKESYVRNVDGFFSCKQSLKIDLYTIF